MSDHSWESQFRAAYARALKAYQDGARTPDACIPAADRAFLDGIGASAQELFDFVEDAAWGGEPTMDEAVGVAALRREYLLREQEGRSAGRRRPASSFPAKSDALSGIPWLPRILAKAEAKLRGELPPDLMYGCGGDRAFLAETGVGLTEFLRAVRDAKGDTASVVAWVAKCRSAVGAAR